MATVIDPTALGFLLAESRQVPMHVGGLQLFRKPEGAPPGYVRDLVDGMRDVPEVSPLFLRHPTRTARSAGQLVWELDEEFDVDYHVRHGALPGPGRVRELLELVSRLHSTRLDWERPLWESTVIEGLRDGRVAMYTKLHHALVDGVSAMRLMASVLSPDPDERDMPAPWALRPSAGRQRRRPDLTEVPLSALRSALGLTAEAAGMPSALVKTLTRSVRNETSALSLYTPRTLINRPITGSRRFAAEDWPLERIRAVAGATGTTINDVVVAMCSGALRSYLLEHGELPAQSLVAMVPVSLAAKAAHGTAASAAEAASASGGNAVGSIMVQLGTQHADAADRLAAVHHSMTEGKKALASMTPLQILAMSALGQAPAVLTPLLRMQGIARAPYNVVISNVPGSRTTQYFNGAQLLGNYPLSIPIHGVGLNITCASYDGLMCFGLTGCRRTVPHLQVMLTYLDEELQALEQAAGL